MKQYRFIAHYAGKKINCAVSANDDDNAKIAFINKLNKGEYEMSESANTPKKIFITFEEI